MNINKKKTVIAGNWKMNKTPIETKNFFKDISSISTTSKCDIILCVPYINISYAVKETEGSNIKIGAQNCHWNESGAFTGEISAKMLKSINTQYVIIGHSERRLYFAETDATVNKKIKAALKEHLKVILCVGESLTDRESNITNEVVSIQVKIALKEIPKEQIENIIIAYEPLWAIGTGKTATAEQADETCSAIRQIISSLYNNSIAENVVIQYGGSMNSKNAQELLSKPNINGGLIGGASLNANEFVEIINIANNKNV